jgi:hypothetical protein
VALLGLSGCSPAGTRGPSATSSTSGSPRTPGRSPAVPTHPCGLLNQNEAVAVIGTAVKAVPINQPNYVGCNYSPSDTAMLTSKGELIAVIFPAVSETSWKDVVTFYTHQAGGHDVSNLGDAALSGQFTAPGGSTTYVAVLRGSIALVVERVIFTGTPASVSTVISLAQTVLGSL